MRERASGKLVTLRRILCSDWAQVNETMANCYQWVTLRHPNIAVHQSVLLDQPTMDGDLPVCLVAEHPTGECLWKVIPALDASGRHHLALGLLEALSFLAQQHQLHNDLRPSNVIVSPADQRPILVGFLQTPGLERFPLGYSDFLSPEAAARTPAPTPASDVFSLGLVLACLALGYSSLDPLRRLLGGRFAWLLADEGNLVEILRPALERAGTLNPTGVSDLMGMLAGDPRVRPQPHECLERWRAAGETGVWLDEGPTPSLDAAEGQSLARANPEAGLATGEPGSIASTHPVLPNLTPPNLQRNLHLHQQAR
ncbi:hypothetical protein PAPYR_8759 [Paratrimastix pyriformis]|uniref:Protein kinase domain-containing protein n=1 Tax=Paratrimastix pyriformis TaxID=342808 RepID=A0ABQ8UEL6_9EUKA|nr:hypothetical protein PAPYR_8759 [Paratrimastix pyriformis]